MKKKAVILHSGGLDSTVCLLLALEKGFEVLSLGIDYGQQSRAELDCALKLCSRFKIERRVLKVEWDKPVRNIPMGRTLDEIRKGVSPAFLPGRNAIFLTLATAEAVGINASQVWIGVNAIDYSGYPDCRPEFITKFNQMMESAIPNAPSIVAPLIGMSKPEIAKEAYRLGIRRDDTWSCYRPIKINNGFKVCEQCDGCILSEYAWKKVL